MHWSIWNTLHVDKYLRWPQKLKLLPLVCFLCVARHIPHRLDLHELNRGCSLLENSTWNLHLRAHLRRLRCWVVALLLHNFRYVSLLLLFSALFMALLQAIYHLQHGRNYTWEVCSPRTIGRCLSKGNVYNWKWIWTLVKLFQHELN